MCGFSLTPAWPRRGYSRAGWQQARPDHVTLIHVAATRAGLCETTLRGYRACPWSIRKPTDGQHMNQLIYIVGFVVIVLIILAFFGLR